MHTNPSPAAAPRKEAEAVEEAAAITQTLSSTGIRRTPVATQRPILASEALREDLAPLKPWDRSLRCWTFGLGLVLVLAGVAFRYGWVPGHGGSDRVALSIGAGVVLSSLLPFPYALRGALALAAGSSLLVLGLLRHGPLQGLVMAGQSSSWEIARSCAATILPAALLFRSRYRAYRGARIALAVGLALAGPACVHAAMVVMQGPVPAQLAAAASILAVLLSLIGFMGAGTTAASTAWAVAVIAAFGGEVMARALWLGDRLSMRLEHVLAGGMFVLAATLAVIGCFQLLASAFARDARRVDVLRTPRPHLPSMERLD